jgi:flagellar protein FliO/FliZ
MGTEYVHVILSLLAVVALMLGLVFLLKKFKLTRYAVNKHIKIINIVPVGAKEKIILMEVNNTVLLVGATPNHIETLHVFNELESKPLLKKPTFVEQMESLNS